jgi:hypothetical protein
MQVDVRGALVMCPEEATGKKKQYATVKTSTRDLQLYSETDMEPWIISLRKAAGNTGASYSAGGAAIPGAATPVGMESPISTPEAVSDVLARIPQLVEIDGIAEVGSELRVRVANMRALDSLCIAWFRFVADALPSPEGDVTADAGAKVISGATGVSYTVSEIDLGHRIGCIVRPPVPIASRWALMNERVKSSVSTVPTIRFTVDAHEHNKYCDRRVRVCTATGRVREGNVLLAILRGPERSVVNTKIVWYRSALLDDYQLGVEGRARSAAAATTAKASIGLVEEAVEEKPEPHENTAASNPHTGAAVSHSRSSNIWKKLPELPYHRVTPRSLADLPPCPPDYAPSAGRDIIYSYISLLEAGAPVNPTIASAAKDPSGPTPGCIPAAASTTGPFRYAMFREDIGRVLVAVLMEAGAAEPETILVPAAGSTIEATAVHPNGAPVVGVVAVTPPAGPVEAAPPKAREIWMEGNVAVGQLLVGHTYYYGGYEGTSEVSWIAINDAGDTIDLKPAAPSDPRAPTPDANAPAGSEADSHPRALRLLPEHAGYLIKYKVKPVRSDGDEGHTESSRPTAEVAP